MPSTVIQCVLYVCLCIYSFIIHPHNGTHVVILWYRHSCKTDLRLARWHFVTCCGFAFAPLYQQWRGHFTTIWLVNDCPSLGPIWTRLCNKETFHKYNEKGEHRIICHLICFVPCYGYKFILYATIFGTRPKFNDAPNWLTRFCNFRSLGMLMD